MHVLISASGSPAKPGRFFIVQFGITLLALPAYYLVGGLLKKDAWAFVAAISVCILVFSALRKILQPQVLSLSIESDGGVRFKGKFEEASIPYSEPKPLSSARIEQGRLLFQSGEAKQNYCLTTSQFQLDTLVALEGLISQVVSGGLPDLKVFPDSVRVSKHQHRGNVAFIISEKPSGAMLQFVALSLGVLCFVALIVLVR